MSCKGLLLLPDAPEDPEEEAETTGDTEATTCDTKLWTAGEEMPVEASAAQGT